MLSVFSERKALSARISLPVDAVTQGCIYPKQAKSCPMPNMDDL